MNAVIVPDKDNKCHVNVYVDRKIFHTTQFESEGLAKAYLVQSGYVRAPAPHGDVWFPGWAIGPFTATRVTQAVACATLELEEDYFRLHTVEVPCGFGFRFGIGEPSNNPLTHEKGVYIGMGAADPLITILTTGLFTVEAIGTWPTLGGAQKAGLAFFKRVQELVGSMELLYKLLEMERDRQHGS